MLNITDLIASRRAGRVRVCYGTNHNYSLNEILLLSGLKPNEDALLPIDKQTAVDILAKLLLKDLVFNSENMLQEEAQYMAEKLLMPYVPEEYNTFFTNALWLERGKTNYFSYTSFTDSLMDGGVLACNHCSTVAIWFEGND